MAAERILVVDDDAESLSLIGSVLERQGYSISKAYNGLMALDRARTDAPALIILDIMMPDMDGFEVARQIRSSPATAHIPIIMFTAKGMTEDKITGFEVGADDYLTKPTHPAELLARVKSVMARSTTPRISKSASSTVKQGSIVVFVGAKGGSGTTTLALNIATAMALSNKAAKIILAEFCPGQGVLGLLLNVPTDKGLSHILKQEHPDLSFQYLEERLVPQSSGVQLFLSSSQPSPSDNRLTPKLAVKLADALATPGAVLLIDMGSGLNEHKRWLLPFAGQTVVIVEPERVAVLRAKQMLGEIKQMGIDSTRLSAVLINRTPTEHTVPPEQIRDALQVPLLAAIAPAPDLAIESMASGVPLIMLHPDSLPAAQIIKLSEVLLERLKATGSYAASV